MATLIGIGKRIDYTKGLGKVYGNYAEDLKSKAAAVKAASEAIALQSYAKLTNAVCSGLISNAQKVAGLTAEAMQGAIKEWEQTPGLAASVVDALEEASSVVGGIPEMFMAFPEQEMPDDLHSELTDETMATYKTALTSFIAAKDDFISALASITEEFETKDTADLLMEIGVSNEAFTNATVDLLDNVKKDLGGFEGLLDDISATVAAKAATASDAASTTAKAVVEEADGALM